mgnify:FL=1
MTGNIKAIRTRMKSVESTRHITRAMQLVAASKLRAALDRMETSRFFFGAVREAFSDLAAGHTASPFLQKRPVAHRCIVIIAGDRGLAGGYNANVFRAVRAAGYDPKTTSAVAIGRRACDFVHAEGFQEGALIESVEKMSKADTVALAGSLKETFLSGAADEIILYYTDYVSALTQEVRATTLLPLTPRGEAAHRNLAETVYEPDPASVLDAIIPQYLTGVLWGAVALSHASETAARRNAMDSATDNASEMLDKLSLAYNRARQGAITQEITEIVAGAGSE